MSVSKIVLLCVSFVVLRAALPRMRFDQLTLLCWKYCFPLAFVLILWEASAFVFWLNADLSLAGSGELANFMAFLTAYPPPSFFLFYCEGCYGFLLYNAFFGKAARKSTL